MQKDRFIPIHNEVAEALARVNLSPYEGRVLWVIFRKTYGYLAHEGGRKKNAIITCKEIAEMTGIDRRIIPRTITGLIKKLVISRDDNGLGFSKQFMSKMSSVEMTNHKNPEPDDFVISRDDKLTSVEMTKSLPPNTPHKVLKKKETPIAPKGDVAQTLPSKAQIQATKAQVYRDTACRILAHLNKATESKFQEVEANLGFITSRLKEKNVTEAVCLAIIDHKTYQWLTLPKRNGEEPRQAEYLRPATLFNKSKFWQYHGQVQAWLERKAEHQRIRARNEQDQAKADREPAPSLEQTTPEQIERSRKFLQRFKGLTALKNKLNEGADEKE